MQWSVHVDSLSGQIPLGLPVLPFRTITVSSMAEARGLHADTFHIPE